MKIPTEPMARGYLYYFAGCIVFAILTWLITPSSESATIGQSGLLMLLRAILPLAIGAMASELWYVILAALFCILLYVLAVTVWRSSYIAAVAFCWYGILTIFVFWIEPFLASTSSAIIQSVGFAVMLKVGIGFVEALFTLFWLLYPIVVRFQLRKEFA